MKQSPEEHAAYLASLEKSCVISPYPVAATGYARKQSTRFGKRIGHHHVLVWIDAHGRLPEPGMDIRHLCDVRNCVEVSHLLEGTRQENVQDMVDRNRVQRYNAEKTHCPAGHEYTEANTYVTGKGFRQCRTCRTEGSSQRSLKKSAARHDSGGITHLTIDQIAEIRRRIAAGESVDSVAEAFKRTAQRIYELTPDVRVRRPALSPEEKAEIDARRRAGESVPLIADALSRPLSTVYHYLKRRQSSAGK